MADELTKLRSQIEELQRKAEEIETKEKTKAIDEIRAKIDLLNISAEDLGFVRVRSPRSHSGPVTRVAPKYRKGTATWTGRGRQPKWVAEHISKGGKIEDLLIK